MPIVSPPVLHKKPLILLHKPQLPENIGMVARAMKNFSFADLALINPLGSHLDDKAMAASAGAEDILERALVYNSLETAAKSLKMLVATTGTPRDMHMPVETLTTAISKIQESWTDQSEKVGILFGCERVGLTNEEISFCDFILDIPTDPAFSSLNLAQAVLLVCYEWERQLGEGSKKISIEEEKAPKEELFYFFHRLESILDQTKFFQVSEKKPGMMMNLRTLFQRAQLSSQEIQTLHGILTELGKFNKNNIV